MISAGQAAAMEVQLPPAEAGTVIYYTLITLIHCFNINTEENIRPEKMRGTLIINPQFIGYESNYLKHLTNKCIIF